MIRRSIIESGRKQRYRSVLEDPTIDRSSRALPGREYDDNSRPQPTFLDRHGIEREQSRLIKTFGGGVVETSYRSHRPSRGTTGEKMPRRAGGTIGAVFGRSGFNPLTPIPSPPPRPCALRLPRTASLCLRLRLSPVAQINKRRVRSEGLGRRDEPPLAPALPLKLPALYQFFHSTRMLPRCRIPSLVAQRLSDPFIPLSICYEHPNSLTNLIELRVGKKERKLMISDPQ